MTEDIVLYEHRLSEFALDPAWANRVVVGYVLIGDDGRLAATEVSPPIEVEGASPSVLGKRGIFGFRVGRGHLTYLGEISVPDDRVVWGVSDLVSAQDAATGELYAVHGWLVGMPAMSCPAPPEYIEDPDVDLSWYCSPGWITGQPTFTIRGHEDGFSVSSPQNALLVQAGAYEEFAPDPTWTQQNGAEPREGIYLVRPAGCPIVVSGECPAWQVVGLAEARTAEENRAVPAEINGEPVLSPEEAIDRIGVPDPPSEPFLIGGWIVHSMADCFIPDDFPATPLLAPCNDGFVMYGVRPDRGSDYFESATVRLVVDANAGGFPTGLEPAVLQVHANDRRAADCPIAYRERCERAIVVEKLVWPDGYAPPTPEPTPDRNFPPLSISNGTSLTLGLSVNGQDIARVAPGEFLDGLEVRVATDLPWSIDATTTRGRTLLTFSIETNDMSPHVGYGARADLSCGRLDIWSGPRPFGPLPPASFPPGDCDP